MYAYTLNQARIRNDLRHSYATAMTTSRNFIVSGRVQGVGFRYATKRMAEQLELSGWVKNLPGGAVEVAATGDPRKLAAFEAWLRAGPAHARVAGVAVTAAEPGADGLGGFHIRV